MPFTTLFSIILTLAVLAQLYLFVRIRQAVMSSRRSRRFQSCIIFLVGITIVVMFTANAWIMFKPIPWVDPPLAAQVLLFYFPAVWGFGSIFCALLLALTEIAGKAGRFVYSVSVSEIQMPHEMAPARPPYRAL